MSGGTLTSPAAQFTDAELVARTRKGDVNAYDELNRRHLPDARRVARIVTDDRAEAESIVDEAFARLLDRLRGGGGPGPRLAPYLRTIIRRLAAERHRQGARHGQPADIELLDVLPTADDEIGRTTERQMVREAFEALPDRWQRVLWHTEVEGRAATALVPRLGSSPNAVAALAYRAREGLRQAYFAVHLGSQLPAECTTYAPMLASYIRQTLPEADDIAVAIHLDTCARCRERRDEMLLLVADMRALLVPALLGATDVRSGSATVARAGADAGGGRWPRPRPRDVVKVAATSVGSAAAVAAVIFAAASAMSTPAVIDARSAVPPPAASVVAPTGTILTAPPATDDEDVSPPTVKPGEEKAEGEGAARDRSAAARPVIQAQPLSSQAPSEPEPEPDATPAAQQEPTSRPDDPATPASSPMAEHREPEHEPASEPEDPDATEPGPKPRRAGLLCRLFPGAFRWCP